MTNQHDKPDNNVIHQETPQGNSKAYSIARVQKECEPEVVEAVMKGELSPNRALVQAGFLLVFSQCPEALHYLQKSP